MDEIKASLEKLQTDHVDLIQIHAVNALGGPGAVPGPGRRFCRAIVDMPELQHIDEIVDIASHFSPISEDDLNALVEEVKPILQKDYKDSQEKGKSDLFRLHDTKVMGWEEKDEPAMVAY